MTFQSHNSSLLRNTFTDLAISLSNIPDVTWQQLECLTKFLPHTIVATSPSTPTNSHSFSATFLTPFNDTSITENNLFSLEAISLFLIKSISKFSDQLFQSLLSFLLNSIHAKWLPQQTHFIAFFFKQAVAKIRWVTEECQLLSGQPNEEFFEVISKLFLELLQKLSHIPEDGSITTVPMLIGIYEGLSLPKKEILKEFEKTGEDFLNLDQTLSEREFQWSRCETMEVIERILDYSLKIVQFCRENMSPDGFSQDYSTYQLQPTVYKSLSHLLTTNPLNSTSSHLNKLYLETKQELSKLSSAYKEVKSGQEFKYYSSFNFRFGSVVDLLVALTCENGEEVCELLLDPFEVKLKQSLDHFQFGVKIHSIRALSLLAKKNPTCRLSIFEAISGHLDSSFINRLSQSMQKEWVLLKIAELDQIQNDVIIQKSSLTNQNCSLSEYISGLVALCVACHGGEEFESFIGRLTNKLLSFKLNTDYHVLQAQLIIALLLRIAVQSNLVFILQTLKGYMTHSQIIGGLILNEIAKVFEFSPSKNLVLKIGDFLIDVLSVSKFDSLRELAKKGILNLLKNEKSVDLLANFALKSVEKLVSCLSETLNLERNQRSKEIVLISSWISIVAECVEKSGFFCDTNDFRVRTLFRDFWLFSVVLDLVSHSDQLKYLQKIASITPIFSVKGNSNFFAFLKGSSLSDKRHMNKATISHLRPRLIQLIDSPIDVSSKLHRLDNISVIFLTSLYHIDTMRLQNSTPKLPTILFYSEDRVIQHQSNDFHKVLCVMANQILAKGVAIKVAQVPATLTRNLELENFAIMLVPRLCTLDVSVRDLSCNTLNSLLSQFPYLHLNKKLLFTILDIHTLLFESLTIARGKPISHLDPKIISGTEFVLNLPDTLDKKKHIFNYFESELRKFFKSAFEFSAENVLAIIQSFVLQSSNSSFGVPGVMHATNIFNQLDFVKSSLDPLDLTHDTFLTLNSPLETVQKLQTFGKVKSEMREKDFLQKLLQLLDQSEFILNLESAICHLAITRENSHSLFESIFRNVVSYFDLKNVSFLLRNLTWLIGMSPEYEYKIFSHICQLLLVTKEKKFGMFTIYSYKDGKVSFDKNPLFDTQTSAHREIIIFLETRFEILKDKNCLELELLVHVLSSILGLFLGPKGISSQPIIPLASTVGVIFRLLFICHSVLSSQSISDNLDTILLRKRIFMTALHYFSFESDWPKQDFEVLYDDIEVMSRFWTILKHESSHISECNVMVPDQIDQIDEIIITRESNSACASPDFTQDFQPAQRSHSFGNLTVDYAHTNHGSSKSNRSHRSIFSSKSAKSGRSSRRHSLSLSSTNESVFETSADSYREILNLEKNILIQVIHSELLKLVSFADPLKISHNKGKYAEEVESFTPVHLTKKKWSRYLRHLWNLSPYLAIQIFKLVRIPLGSPAHSELTNLVSNHPIQVIKNSFALELFLTKHNLETDRNDLSLILSWEPPTIIFALTLSTPQFPRHPLTAQLSHSVLLTADRDQLIFNIPQIVQALRTDQLGFIWHSIVGAAKKSQLFAHQAIWNMKTNMFTDENSEHKDEQLFDTLEQLIDTILNNLSGKSLEFYRREIDFFNKVTGISGQIRHIPIGPARDQACLDHFSQIVPEIGVYIPSNPEYSVIGIDHQSAKPMQSAEKAPFRAKFKVKKFDLETQDESGQSDLSEEVSNGTHWQACIFKVGDDIRQDMLALQIMTLFKNVLEKAGLELYFKPYKVVCTEPGCGIIECVPDAISRDQLGRKTDTNLYDYFLATFGDVLSNSFKEARINFIKSLAAYSIFSYLIQIKDRHNGNILITNQGHIIHIDFGFMFESSPGGNLGFEPHVKLTQEMLLIMGGDVNAAPYIWFRELCVRGYLALRPFCDEVVRIVNLMLDTKLPCFRGNTLEPLKSRFSPGASEKQASSAIIRVMDDSLLNIRTKGYDILQKIQNHIAS